MTKPQQLALQLSLLVLVIAGLIALKPPPARAGLSFTCPSWAASKCMTLDAAGLLTVNLGACGIQNISVVAPAAPAGTPAVTAMPAKR